MTTAEILRSKDFSEVAEVAPDAKRRITLKRVAPAGKRYKVYVNSLGQVILDPQVSIPASELWLHEDKAALASVRRGLAQSRDRKVRKKPSLARHAGDKLD